MGMKEAKCTLFNPISFLPSNAGLAKPIVVVAVVVGR
jgi:hypothetical protein